VRKAAAGILIGFGAAGVVLAAVLLFNVFGAFGRGTSVNPFHTIELKTYDWRLAHTANPSAARKDIALVEIDEYSLRNLEPNAGRWPWPRGVHAMLVDYLARAPAKVVAYDVLFSERDSRTGAMSIIEPNVGRPTGRSAIAEGGGVELVYTAYCDAAGLPLPEARTQQYVGTTWLDVRRDVQAAVVGIRRGELTAREWLTSLRGPRTHAIWSARDPRPFVTDLTNVARTAARRGR